MILRGSCCKGSHTAHATAAVMLSSSSSCLINNKKYGLHHFLAIHNVLGTSCLINAKRIVIHCTYNLTEVLIFSIGLILSLSGTSIISQPHQHTGTSHVCMHA